MTTSDIILVIAIFARLALHPADQQAGAHEPVAVPRECRHYPAT